MSTDTKIPEDAEIIVQKAPCDMGIHRNPRKGTLDAPERILRGLSVEKNILETEIFPDEFNLEETHDRIFENTLELAGYGKPIVSLGGDHSISFPTVHALKQENPDMNLVWVDAHLDVKNNVDGHVSHDVVVRELLEENFSIDDIFFVGITREDEDEKNFLQGKDAQTFGSDDLEDFKQAFPSEEKTYLSLDIDVLSKDLAPGTGYPDGNLSVEQVLEIIKEVKPCYADVVEVAPTLDREGNTLENSRKILSSILQHTREPE